MAIDIPTIKRHALWAGVSVIAALAQFRIITLVFGQNYLRSIDAALGVVKGYPHWRLYQSRVLGPWLIEALSGVTGDFINAHVFYTIAMTALAGWLILALMRRSFGGSAAWAGFLFFHLLFSLLLGDLWLYAWDHGGIVVFILFTHFVLVGKDWRWFAALFAVAILNRESAFYIALWMIVDPPIKAFFDRARLRPAMVLAGIVCMGGGLELVGLLRDTLLVHEIGPERFGMPELAGKAVHFKWAANLEFIRAAMTTFSFGFEFLIPLFLCAVLALAVALAWRDPRSYLGLAITQAAMVTSMLIVALIQETRVLLELIPFMVLGIAALRVAGSRELQSPGRTGLLQRSAALQKRS